MAAPHLNNAADGAANRKNFQVDVPTLGLASSVEPGLLSPSSSFTAGDLVIYRVGDGSSALGAGGTPIFLDEYKPDGTLVQSIPLPTTASGANKRITASGSATSEGLLSLSPDGKYVFAAGYDAAVGASGIATSTATTVNRVIARVDASGSVDTSTALSDFSSGSNPRGVVSTNGTDIWVTGGAGGVRYTTLGSNTSTQLTTTPLTNWRAVNIFNGQLFATTQTGTTVRLGLIGTGLPTSGTQTVTNLPGFLASSGSPYSFLFLDASPDIAGPDTLYVADDNTAGGAIQKYSFDGSTWTARGTVTLAGVRGITGKVNGPTVVLYVTSSNGSLSTFQTLTDTAAYNANIAASLTNLVTAPTSTAFRGIAFAPSLQPGALQFNLSAFAGNENAGTIGLTVTRSNGTDGQVGGTITFTNGTAIGGASCSAGVDFVNSPINVSFSAGSSSPFTANVPVCNDSIARGTRTFSASLGSLTGGASAGAPALATITIGDDDVAGVAITQSGGSTNVMEGGASDSYTVVLNSQPTSDVVVSVSPDSQIAVSPNSMIFTSANWNTPQTVTVTAVDDTAVEGSHTGAITHSATSSDAGYNGITISGVTANITDNDTIPGTFEFGAAGYSGVEGGQATITVLRSGGTNGYSSVQYAASNGTATGGACGGASVDFASTSGTLIFTPGESAKTFTVDLCADLAIENPAETLNLVLSNPIGGSLGTQSSSTLKILDAASQYSSSQGIFFTDGNPGSVYPTTINVSGYSGNIGGVRLTLYNVTRPTMHDLSIILAGPNGKQMVVLSNVGDASPVNGGTITLEDTATAFMPSGSPVTDGQNYKPTDCFVGPHPDFPSPAPAGPYLSPGCTSATAVSFASTFGNISPNGDWHLYTMDEAGTIAPLAPAGVSSFVGGWGIQFLAPTAANTTIAGRVRTADGHGIFRATVTIEGGGLASPRTVLTNPFGYYTIGEVPAGQTYILTVRAKNRYFAEPTKVVNLLDALTGLDFVAGP